MITTFSGLLIPMHGFGHVFCRADAVFVAMAEPVLPGDVARFGRLQEVGKSGFRIVSSSPIHLNACSRTLLL